MSEIIPFDPSCERHADEIDEYIMMAEVEGYESPEDFVRYEEGTFNKENGHFLCNACYIKAGMPSAFGGWVCP